jgi:hypothetical protein
VSGEAERAAAVRAEQAAEQRAELHELIVAELDEAMSEHGQVNGAVSPSTRGRCECGYVEPHGLGIGLHQLEAAASAVLELLARRGLLR